MSIPDPARYGSLLDILDDAAARHGDRPLMSQRGDEGTAHSWSALELRHRARLVAWRLRALGIQPGDRLLTWSPPGPEMPAVYFGAMMAGVPVVPIDLRMTPEVVERICHSAEAAWLAVGTGRDAPEPREAGLEHLPARTMAWLTAEPAHENAAGTDEGGLDPTFPPDWEAQVAAWPRPTRDDLFEIVYTSGTTGQPKGVMLDHGNILATLEATSKLIPPWEHRIVSLLPLSHLFGQLELLYVLLLGANVLYLRSRNPRVIFESLRNQRVTTMVVVPQVLELFWQAITREVEKQGQLAFFERLRRIARRLPYWARRLLFRRLHDQLGGQLRLFVSAAAFLPPALQQAWEDVGVIVMQGYGATECGFASATSVDDHPVGSVGRPAPPTQLRLSEEGEIQIGGPTVFAGYWRDPQATAAALAADGWYRTGDVGRFDERGNLVLSGRIKNIIVLPNGLNVFPEDIENALKMAGLGETVVIETAPGRIEAVVLPPGQAVMPRGDGSLPEGRERTAEESAELRRTIDAAVKTANASLSMHQKVAAWRLWPGGDFPRTHTLKVKRDQVRAWAAADAPLPVRSGSGEVGGG
ncbi:MAG TPA: AMP-binding protein [Candidatus Limnocylindrales bacterium]|nr:AMP-binding protein [Candidatus Limnocylindrales bacterium]